MSFAIKFVYFAVCFANIAHKFHIHPNFEQFFLEGLSISGKRLPVGCIGNLCRKSVTIWTPFSLSKMYLLNI